MPPTKNLILEDFRTKLELLKHIEEMLKQDPDYEVFVPMVYYKTKRYTNLEIMPKFVFNNKYISNRGRVITKNSLERVNKIWRKGRNGPLKVTIQENGKGVELELLRALASTFIPISSDEIIEDGAAVDPVCLDGDFDNLSLRNIGWVNYSSSYIPNFLKKVEETPYEIENLKQYEGEEVFKPLSYIGLGWGLNKPLNFTTNLYWVGNKGTVWSFVNKRRPFMMSPTLNKDKYPTVRVSLGDGKSVNLPIHRILACTFIPVIGFEMETESLTVNHLDGNKSNYELKNLEWTTQQENSDHAFATGLSKNKPIKGTFIEGPLVGQSFILIGGKDQIKNGFSPGNVCNVIKGKRKYHKGCTFCFATDEEVATLPRADRLAKSAARNPTEVDTEYSIK